MKPLLAALLLATGAAAQEGHDFFTGQATVADPSAERRLARFPCHSCHGRDGLGGIEGNVPPIEWSLLSVPSVDRPGYDAQSFYRAVTEGVASDGRELSRLMPRYALTEAETGILRGYLRALHAKQRQGVWPKQVRIGVATIPGAEAISEAYHAAVAEALAQRLGGDRAYGRQIVLVPVDPATPAATRDVLAVVGVPVAATVAFTRRGVPVLAPVGALSGDEDPSILRGITPSREALHAALARAVAEAGEGPVAILTETEAERDAFALALSLAAPGRRLTDTAAEAEDIVVLDATPFAGQRAARVWITWQSLASRTARDGGAPVMVALETPRLVSDAIEAQVHPLLIHAQQAGIMLAEALKAAGRDVTRARLLQALDETVLSDIGLDYDRHRLTGTEDIAIFPLP